MSSYLTEDVVPVSYIVPDAWAAKTTEGDASAQRIDMRKGYGHLAFYVLQGDVGNVVFQVQQSVTGNSGWSAISGKSFSGAASDNKIRIVELRPEEMSDTAYWVRPYLYVDGGANDIAVLVLASKNRYGVPQYLSSVQTILRN